MLTLGAHMFKLLHIYWMKMRLWLGWNRRHTRVGGSWAWLIFLQWALITVDMAQMPSTFKQSLQMEFNTYLTRSEGSGVVFMKAYEGEQGYEHKENKCGSDYLGGFGACALERPCMHSKHTVLEQRLESWRSVLWLEHGHWDYYRSGVFLTPQNPEWTFTLPMSLPNFVTRWQFQWSVTKFS